MTALLGCQRDRARPLEPPAPAESPRDARPPAPEAARPNPQHPAEPSIASALECFGEPKSTPIDQWLKLYATADVNGDGHVDAVIGYDILRDDFTAYVAVYLGDGDGGFRAADEVAIGPMSYDVAVGDFDADGHLDLLAPNIRQRTVVMLRGRGDGTFERAADISAGPRPGQVAAGDLDGDGHLDAVVVHDRQYQVLGGDGTGALRAGPVVRTDEAPEKPAVVDLDGDGRLDLLFVYNDAMNAAMLRGRGDRTFTRGAGLEQVCDGPYSVVTGDFDRDGAPDGAFTCLRTDAIGILHNRNGGARFELDHISAEAGQSLAVGDVTGDGIADIVALGQRRGRPMQSNATLLEGDGEGGFRVRARAIIDGHSSDPLLADVNGDGRLDLVATRWTGRRPGSIAVWFGTSCADGGSAPDGAVTNR